MSTIPYHSIDYEEQVSKTFYFTINVFIFTFNHISKSKI